MWIIDASVSIPSARDAPTKGLSVATTGVPSSSTSAIHESGALHVSGMPVPQTRPTSQLGDAWYRQLADATPGMNWAVGFDRTFTWYNRRWLEFTGRTLEEEVRGGWPNGVHPDDKASVLATWESSFAARRPFQVQYRLRRRDGEYRWLLDCGAPIDDESGQFLGFAGTCVDVTEFLYTQDALEASAAQYEHLVNSLDCIVWESCPVTSRLNFVSPQARRITGYDVGEWLRPGFWGAHIHPDDRERAVSFCRDEVALGRDHQFEYRFRAADGTYLWLRDYTTLVREGGELVALRGILVDITEQKRAEEQWRESEERFRQIYETINEIFYMVELDPHRLVCVSPSFEKITGVPCADLFAEPSSWTRAVHPEDRPRVIDAWKTCLITRKFDMEYRIIRPDGTIRWFHDRTLPIEGGRLRRYAGVATDITDRKQAEQAKRFLEAQAHTVRKLDALSSLADSVAHEFNNYLSVIRGSAGRLLHTLEDARPTAWIRDGIEQIVAASERATRLTRQLSRMAQRRPEAVAVVDAHQAVRDVMLLIRHALRSDIQIRWNEFPGPLFVRVDRARLEQAIINLVLNARDAMPDGGELSLDVSEGDDLAAPNQVVQGPCAGPMVLIAVRDTGIGVDPAHMNRLFEPFFTTKGEAGTGLGLSFVADFARDHGGCVRAESTPGHGSCFFICLPRIPEDQETNPATA